MGYQSFFFIISDNETYYNTIRSAISKVYPLVLVNQYSSLENAADFLGDDVVIPPKYIFIDVRCFNENQIKNFSKLKHKRREAQIIFILFGSVFTAEQTQLAIKNKIKMMLFDLTHLKNLEQVKQEFYKTLQE